MKRISTTTVIIALAISVSSVGAWSALRATSSATPPLGLAAAMPRGALAYVEARDLHALLGAWIASETRSRYLASASYRSFRRSRLYVKLQERLADLAKGFGFAINDETLAAFAGARSAVAVYDPSRLDMLLVTETTYEQALASMVFAQAKTFTERRTSKGNAYFAKDVPTQSGYAVLHVAFAWAGGRVWIGTNEGLLAEALDGVGEGLGASVAETVRAAGDFASHDVLAWLDLERVVRNKYFDLYWIQRNGAELSDLASALIDVEFAADGVHERRWFVTKSATTVANAEWAGLARLIAAVPPGTQLSEARVADERLADAVSETLFGPEVKAATLRGSPVRDESVFAASDSGTRSAPGGRFRVLDERFQRDVDDPSVVSATPAPATSPTFLPRLSGVLQAARPKRYAVYGAVDLPPGELFCRFHNTVIVELDSPAAFDRGAYEATVTEEFGRRFLVGAGRSALTWRDADGARTLATSLLAQGGSYRVVDRYLVFARDSRSCAAAAAALGNAGAPKLGVVAGSPLRVAQVRLAEAAGPFGRLTGVLDSREAGELVQLMDADADPLRRPVLFFSENLVSLLDVVREVHTVTIVTTREGAILRERVDYVWGG
jgi:hypothetical protein